MTMDPRTRLFSSTGLFDPRVILVLFCLNWTPADASKKSPPPPSDVVFNQSRLIWNSSASDVSFSVEYRSFNLDWTQVETCSNTPLTSCDFRLEQDEQNPSCVRLRVAALRNGIKSESVEGCSREGHPCSPNFTLTAAPESLTVNLNRNYTLHRMYESSLKYRIHFGKKGEQLEVYNIVSSSELIKDLEVGQTYCVKVEFVLYFKSLGPASCEQCMTIPDFSGSKQTQIVVISIVIFAVVLLVGFAYIHLFKSKKIKEILKPPYTIPLTFKEPLSGRNYPFLAVSPSEECYDVVSNLTPNQARGGASPSDASPWRPEEESGSHHLLLRLGAVEESSSLSPGR
ncbi:interferon gamma receptor 2 [Anableps anableps]